MERETGRIYSTFALDKEFYSEVFLLFSGPVFGNGIWVVSEFCEIRDTSCSACQKRGGQGRGPALKPEATEEPQWLPTPPIKKLLKQSLVATFWEELSMTEGQGANIPVSTKGNKLIKRRPGQNVDNAEPAGWG